VGKQEAHAGPLQKVQVGDDWFKVVTTGPEAMKPDYAVIALFGSGYLDTVEQFSGHWAVQRGRS